MIIVIIRRIINMIIIIITIMIVIYSNYNHDNGNIADYNNNDTIYHIII